ncbi:MAG: hypothetical protein NTW87_18680 [Planctomycetota bacterium]|nr:hypothetical protein [Planctomycetota bacterium]
MLEGKLAELDAILRQAVAAAYAARPAYDTECGFKYELFHQMAERPLDGAPLAQRVPGTPTCQLHGEAKPQNGNAFKADLLVCDPRHRMEFNYAPVVVIELKKALCRKDLKAELERYETYRPAPRALYLVSANDKALTQAEIDGWLTSNGRTDVTVLTRDNIAATPAPAPSQPAPEVDAARTAQTIEECIRDTLQLYGRGRQQYHGFFWCNYELEQDRGWTFPSEGDFNCHLYHGLRSRLPATVEVSAEVKPSGLNKRVDLFITCQSRVQSFTIEVKMNWDQFRYEGVREVGNILHKFTHCTTSPNTAYLVVIQGEDGHKSNHKERALKAFRAAPMPMHLLMYDERNEKPVCQILGRGAQP